MNTVILYISECEFLVTLEDSAGDPSKEHVTPPKKLPLRSNDPTHSNTSTTLPQLPNLPTPSIPFIPLQLWSNFSASNATQNTSLPLPTHFLPPIASLSKLPDPTIGRKVRQRPDRAIVLKIVLRVGRRYGYGGGGQGRARRSSALPS